MQGVRQGCSLYSVLLNIYTDDAIKKQKLDSLKGIYLRKGFYLIVLKYAKTLKLFVFS